MDILTQNYHPPDLWHISHQWNGGFPSKVGLNQRGNLNPQWMLMLKLLAWFKPIKNNSVSIPTGTQQRISQKVLNLR